MSWPPGPRIVERAAARHAVRLVQHVYHLVAVLKVELDRGLQTHVSIRDGPIAAGLAGDGEARLRAVREQRQRHEHGEHGRTVSRRTPPSWREGGQASGKKNTHGQGGASLVDHQRAPRADAPGETDSEGRGEITDHFKTYNFVHVFIFMLVRSHPSFAAFPGQELNPATFFGSEPGISA